VFIIFVLFAPQGIWGILTSRFRGRPPEAPGTDSPSDSPSDSPAGRGKEASGAAA
jgi:hypothetical protein